MMANRRKRRLSKPTSYIFEWGKRTHFTNAKMTKEYFKTKLNVCRLLRKTFPQRVNITERKIMCKWQHLPDRL